MWCRRPSMNPWNTSTHHLLGSVVQPNTGSRGYDFVASTPTPVPHAGGATPMITWGEMDSTPLLLDKDTDPGPVFRLPDPPEREVMAKKLSDDASRSIRERQTRLKTPSLLATRQVMKLHNYC
jgi:hypothetical protein